METKDVIRTNRLKLGLTEQQLADRVGVSRGSVQQWEKGKTAPKRGNQDAVAAALGIDKALLMGLTFLPAPDASDSRVTPFPVVTLESALERLSYFLEQVPQADRGSSSAALAALALNPADHARKALLIKLLIESVPAPETEKFGAKAPKS
jgi:transcriptional regulator with XRE-family HTH domain